MPRPCLVYSQYYGTSPYNHKLYINKRALGHWVAHMRMTDKRSGIFCENLVECIMRNNSVFGSVAQEMSLKDFLSGALAVLLFGAAESFMQF